MPYRNYSNFPLFKQIMCNLEVFDQRKIKIILHFPSLVWNIRKFEFGITCPTGNNWAGWLSTVEVIPVRESPAVTRISLSGCLYIGPFISASKEDVKTGIKGSPSSSALLMSATFSTKFICPLGLALGV